MVLHWYSSLSPLEIILVFPLFRQGCLVLLFCSFIAFVTSENDSAETYNLAVMLSGAKHLLPISCLVAGDPSQAQDDKMRRT